MGMATTALRRLIACGLLLWLAGAATAHAETDTAIADRLIREAEALLVAGRAEDAFRLLIVREPELAGHVMFDYTLGVSASEANRNAAAMRAFGRVRLAEPEFAGAALEYARALALSGDALAARTEYQRLLATDKSAPVQSMAREGLAQIESRRGLHRSVWTPAVEVAAGYDSNVNFSTSDTSFLGFALDPRFVRQGSALLRLGGSLSHYRALGDNASWSNLLIGTYRTNPSVQFADEALVGGSTALTYSWPKARGSLVIGGGYAWIDGLPHRRALSGELGWSRSFAGHWELSALGRAGIVDYLQPDIDVFDVVRLLNGVAIARSEIGRRSARLGIAAIGGRDIARLDDSPYSVDRYGLRLFGNLLPSRSTELYGDVSYFVADFFDGGGFLGIDRLDRQLAASLGLNVANWPRSGWRVNPQLTAVRNESNLSFYAYRQVVFTVRVTYEFGRL